MWVSRAHFTDGETETGRLGPLLEPRSRPVAGSAQLPRRLREGQVACKELSGRQCCGSARGARRAEGAAGGSGSGAGSWGWRREVRGRERGSDREIETRRSEPRTEPQPALGAQRPRHPGAGACAGPRRGPGHPQCRPPASPPERHARQSLAFTSSRLRPPPRLAGWRRHRLLVPGHRCRRCCNPERTLFHFPAGGAEDAPCTRPKEINPEPG